MARKSRQKQVEDYRHSGSKRLNNPPAALAREDLQEVPTRKFNYDPHFPPELWWAGKDHAAELELEAPSIHIHERLSAEAIVKSAQREDPQLDFFGDPGLDRSSATEFYEHEMDWVNRLILGDSVVAMGSLLERERLGGRVQMIYIDPPYGINFNSNFQARISESTPRELDDKALTREPEQIQAYRDTWEMGIHSYLTYLRERLIVSRDLLSDDGSIFVQIGPDNVHLARVLLDEVFGPENACPLITFQKTSQARSKLVSEVSDFLLWYAKDRSSLKYRPLVVQRGSLAEHPDFDRVLEADGSSRKLTAEERLDPSAVPAGSQIYKRDNPTSQGYSRTKTVPLEVGGNTYECPSNRHWMLRVEGMEKLWEVGRLEPAGESIWYRRFWSDAGAKPLSNIWIDTSSSFAKRKFVVQTIPKVVERCIAMTTDPGDLVLDPTCGSGTTAWAAEKLGRRWVTIDTSRVAVAIARQRLLTAKFDYFQLKDPERGVDGGLEYEALQRVTASTIGYGNESESDVFYDVPKVDRSKIRVSGPFTVEGLSRYAINPYEPEAREESTAEAAADHVSILLEALKSQGIPRQNGAPAPVLSLMPLPGGGILHAEGNFQDADGSELPFAVSLGPRHGPITPLQVDEALAESPGYKLIVFAGFSATAEAQEYLAPGKRGRIRVALLEANPDLLLGDLLKHTKASQTFRLFSAPEIELHREGDGEVVVEVIGMDTFDAATGEVISRDRDQIACWLLDTDYDGTIFHANQAFFTVGEAWKPLARALQEVVDEEGINRLNSFRSLPFREPASGKIAVRVIDDAGSTSERVLVVGHG